MSDLVLKTTDLMLHHRGRGGGSVVAALDGVTIGVHRGECLAVVGESGCGKTTLARLLVGLGRPTAGDVILNRLSLFDGDREKRRSLRRQVQLVFQDAAGSLNPWRRVGATVAEGIKVHRLAVGEAVGVEVVRLFEEVGLAPDSVDRFPNQLSGGQRQRVGLARALAVGPEVLVADEPLSALDVSVQTRILELLADLKSKDGMTVVLISHDLAAVRLLADRIAVMYLGRVVEVAPSKAILSSPAHPYTQMLLESVPEADPNIRTRSAVIYGEPPNPASPPKGCAFHPRCPNADASCQTTRPQLKTVAHGHDVACLLVPESG